MPRIPSARTLTALALTGALAGSALAALPIAAALRATAQPGKAAAQAAPSPAAAPRPVPSEPGATTASFGDWVLRCQRGGGEKPVRICEAAQTMQVQGQQAPIAQIAVGRTGPGEPLLVTAILPPNVALPGSVRVLTDEKDTTGFELAWRRCLPGGCVADAPARDEVLKRWRGSSEPGRIAFRNATGQDVAIPLSFRGLAQALDALGKEPV